MVMSHTWVFLQLDEIGTIAFGISGFTARKQKKKTRMHSSRMRTTRSSSRPRGVSTRYPPGPGTPPPETRHPPGTRHPPEQTPPISGTPGTRHPPPVNRMTNRCKNITLPQTSFAGGNQQQNITASGD